VVAMNRTYITALVATAALVACGGSSTGPGGGGNLTVKVTDPIGDTYGVDSVQWDISALTITRDTGGISIALDFNANVLSPLSGDSNAIFGEIDFDTDQNPATGDSSFVDLFGPGTGATGIGVDYLLDMFDYNTSDSTVNVLVFHPNDSSYTQTGSVRLTFSGKRISGRIPRTLLGGDDGFLNAAAIFGTFFEPTDIAPNTGHLKVGGTGPVPPAMSGVAALRGPTLHKGWGPRPAFLKRR
jgi:hypothetical protein